MDREQDLTARPVRIKRGMGRIIGPCLKTTRKETLLDMKMKRIIWGVCAALGILMCAGCQSKHPGADLAEREQAQQAGPDVREESGLGGQEQPDGQEGQAGPGGQELPEDPSVQRQPESQAEPGALAEQERIPQGTTVSTQSGPSADPAAAAHPEASEKEEKLLEEVEGYLEKLTLEEKVAQLFIVLPEALMKVDRVTAAGETTRNAIHQIPVGGFIYMAGNLTSADQVKTMLSNVQAYSMERTGLPAFLSVDEEGGTVTRISGKGKFDVPDIGDMAAVGQTNDTAQAKKVGTDMGTYLADLGFNMDFAPVADVLSNPENTVVKSRSFGSDPKLVSDMSLALAEGLREQGILSVFKHFPGHGATAGDTHAGYAFTDKTLEDLLSCELIPFQRCIEEKAGMIMVGHISLPGITGSDMPASLSPEIINEVLRGRMGYDGVVVTDALDMGAIVQQFSSAEAAVKVLTAGADLILMPENFDEAYQGVLDAVKDGTLSPERIDESLRRILKVKLGMKQDKESA